MVSLGGLEEGKGLSEQKGASFASRGEFKRKGGKADNLMGWRSSSERHGVFGRPLAGRLVVALTIGAIDNCNLWGERIVWESMRRRKI